jgi:ribosomal protein S18 acetylase RimI-like enzyme
MNVTLDLLDNPIFNALMTRHADLSIGDDRARRYLPEFTCLAGLRDNSAESFESLHQAIGDATVRISSHEDPILPKDWICDYTFEVSQMVCNDLKECKGQELVILTPGDVPEMLELIKLANPGPFYKRSIEFGTFVGIRYGAKLVAMAGERIKLPGLDEISAVSTHPDYQGRGYARALVHAVCQNIRARGNTPFLTVRTDNPAGIRSYQSVGFKQRRTLKYSFVRHA